MDHGIPLPLWCCMAHDHSHTNNSYQNPACCSCGSCVMGKPNITPSNANINPSRRSSIHTAMDAKMAAKHLRCHPVPPQKKMWYRVWCAKVWTYHLISPVLFVVLLLLLSFDQSSSKTIRSCYKNRWSTLLVFVGHPFRFKMFSSQKFRRLEASRSHWSQLEVEV